MQERRKKKPPAQNEPQDEMPIFGSIEEEIQIELPGQNEPPSQIAPHSQQIETQNEKPNTGAIEEENSNGL